MRFWPSPRYRPFQFRRAASPIAPFANPVIDIEMAGSTVASDDECIHFVHYTIQELLHLIGMVSVRYGMQSMLSATCKVAVELTSAFTKNEVQVRATPEYKFFTTVLSEVMSERTSASVMGTFRPTAILLPVLRTKSSSMIPILWARR